MTEQDLKYQELKREYEKLREENDKLKNAHDFNHLFAELEKDCKEKEVCNAFEYITLGELIDLNELMDRVIVFAENADEEELEDMECGYEILKLYRLVDRLFTRYIEQDDS